MTMAGDSFLLTFGRLAFSFKPPKPDGDSYRLRDHHAKNEALRHAATGTRRRDCRTDG